LPVRKPPFGLQRTPFERGGAIIGCSAPGGRRRRGGLKNRPGHAPFHFSPWSLSIQSQLCVPVRSPSLSLSFFSKNTISKKLEHIYIFLISHQLYELNCHSKKCPSYLCQLNPTTSLTRLNNTELENFILGKY
jgi:hypothetical protein